MNLQELRYLAAVADTLHFGRAAEACNVTQPTLSSQIRKLESELGVTLLERTNKRVEITPAGRQILAHAREALAQAAQIEAVARASRDPLVGPLRLGVIPTLAPYLMPHILKPLRAACPGLVLELWENQTRALNDGLRAHRLDAALLATPAAGTDLAEVPLFEEPLLAALPPRHTLAEAASVDERDLEPELLVVPKSDGQGKRVDAGGGRRRGGAGVDGTGTGDPGSGGSGVRGSRPGAPRTALQNSMQAATLETLVNLVAAGYGTTLIPALAAESLSRLDIAVRPLAHRSSRTIRLVSRRGFPRPQALEALRQVIVEAVRRALPDGFAPRAGAVEKRSKTSGRNPQGSRRNAESSPR